MFEDFYVEETKLEGIPKGSPRVISDETHEQLSHEFMQEGTIEIIPDGTFGSWAWVWLPVCSCYSVIARSTVLAQGINGCYLALVAPSVEI